VLLPGRQEQKPANPQTRMDNPAYTWIRSVNADNPINKEKADKIRAAL
jgi:hypothetical protein